MTELHHGPPISTTWVKSSFSTAGQGCVQVRSHGENEVEIGDTKNPDGPTLHVPDTAWQHFLDQVAAKATEYTGRLQPRFLPDGGFTLTDIERVHPPVLAYTKSEWDTFYAGVLAGEFRGIAA